ncbi:hypothetical protein [Fusibacter ferrireducens]|uniref:Uncharacterized protein n=1 Tax=Fusibacter ferrireducens TaxID=2785058 RepID=A0ABR9ZN39_9FIRM|nr:hypothetical protein [Fusibacter ferrireducens]MBF4691883.1 hypothetical protein [Fusibacter ferrireducens]
MKTSNATQAIKKVINPVQKVQDSQVAALQGKVEKVRRQMQNLVLNKNLTRKEKDAEQKVLQHKLDVISQKIVVRQNQVLNNEYEMMVNESTSSHNMSYQKSYQEILDEKIKALQKKA